jgi:hypothetical protein
MTSSRCRCVLVLTLVLCFSTACASLRPKPPCNRFEAAYDVAVGIPTSLISLGPRKWWDLCVSEAPMPNGWERDEQVPLGPFNCGPIDTAIKLVVLPVLMVPVSLIAVVLTVPQAAWDPCEFCGYTYYDNADRPPPAPACKGKDGRDDEHTDGPTPAPACEGED